MKKSHFSLLAGLLLSFFLVVSCTPSSILSPIPLELNYTVTFINVDSTFETSTVPFGGRVEKPSHNPYKSYNYFMYWSESKASQAAATEFNFTTPITRDITLYAIYSPRLASSPIQKLTSSQIEIKFSDDGVYPLEDGSYAGIKFQRSTDDINYQDFPLSVPTSYRDSSGYRYVTYTFPTPLPGGTTNWIKVSNYNSNETDKKSVTPLLNPKTVTFNDNGEIIATIEVESGAKITSSQTPSNPSKSYNTFLYWSTSKASKSAVVEFDFNTPITENITLYSIYTPWISLINSITPTQIQIKLTNTAVYPLDDGSYAGLKVQYSPYSGSSNYQDIDITVPVDSTDTDSYRYITYSFPSNFSLDSSVTTHWFRVTNGTQTKTTSKELSPAAAVTNINATTDDSYAKISFTTVCSGWSYKVQAFKNGSEAASKTITITENNTIGNVEFFGLQNGTSYTFKVTTDGSNYYSETTATPSIPVQKKSSDWLLLMYMDGDNNLHNSIYTDLNEAEYGLKRIRNSDGITALSSYDSVNVVALWDGATSWGTGEYDSAGNEKQAYPTYGESGSYIFELGTDSFQTNYLTSSGYVLSNNTKNLSYTASWLCPNVSESTNQKNYHGEVNMGSKQTLIDFLNWAQAHYTATKGIILQFSNHGGGPRSMLYAQAENGRTYKIGDDNERRALCWDDSSAQAFLKTKDVSDALTTAGFTGSNKLSMILMDVCLGSSIEDAYQFRNNAQYLAASPNNIPGSGLDYEQLMRSFQKNTTIENIGKQIVTDYKGQYTSYSTREKLWNRYAQLVFGYDYSRLSNTQKQTLEWLGDVGITTFTITDLSEITAVKTAVDNMCNILLSDTGKLKTINVDDDGIASSNATPLPPQNYVQYLGKQHADIISNAYYNYTIYYQGSYTWLYDIGYFADKVKSVSSGTTTSNVNAWPELYNAASTVVTALNSAIKYSWRDTRYYSLYDDFYSFIDDSTTPFSHHYGLVVAGYTIDVSGGSLVKGKCASWYKTDLAFGADSKWGDLLTYWFGAGN